MAYYLMIKEALGHNLKYLCKCGDYKDPHKYKGSGVYWRRFIKKHNPEIKTTILGLYESKEELRKAGELYSEKFDIVHDTTWANLIPEIGDGGRTVDSSKYRAYRISNPKEQKFFNKGTDLPKGWAKGGPKWKKNKDGVEKTRQAHIGKKRSNETKERMKAATRKPRMTVKCQYCQKSITPQNIKRHERICNG